MSDPAEASRPSPFALVPVHGEVGGKYRLLGELGSTATTTAYLAVAKGSLSPKKLTVIKELRQELSRSSEVLQSFLEEAQLASRLTHPNVVRTFGVSSAEGRYYIATEYLDGASLATVLERCGYDGPLKFAHLVRVLMEVLTGLGYAHDMQDYGGTPMPVVHRDVTPANVVIAYDGRVKLVDFGVAKVESSLADRSAKGKAHYIAPEIAAAGEADFRADLYSVGAMLWEFAAGRKRWGRLPDALILQRLASEGAKPQPTGAEQRGLPKSVDDICNKALAPLARDRYGSAAEMRAALQGLLAELPSQPTAHDVGDVVAGVFAEEREQRYTTVDERFQELLTESHATASSPPLLSPVGDEEPSTLSTLETDETDDPPTVPLVRGMEDLPPELAMHAAQGSAGTRAAMVPATASETVAHAQGATPVAHKNAIAAKAAPKVMPVTSSKPAVTTRAALSSAPNALEPPPKPSSTSQRTAQPSAPPSPPASSLPEPTAPSPIPPSFRTAQLMGAAALPPIPPAPAMPSVSLGAPTPAVAHTPSSGVSALPSRTPSGGAASVNARSAPMQPSAPPPAPAAAPAPAPMHARTPPAGTGTVGGAQGSGPRPAIQMPTPLAGVPLSPEPARPPMPSVPKVMVNDPPPVVLAPPPISATQPVPPQISFAIPDGPPSEPRPHVVLPGTMPAIPRPVAAVVQGPSAEDDFADGASRRTWMTVMFLVLSVVAGAALGLIYRKLLAG